MWEGLCRNDAKPPSRGFFTDGGTGNDVAAVLLFAEPMERYRLCFGRRNVDRLVTLWKHKMLDSTINRACCSFCFPASCIRLNTILVHDSWCQDAKQSLDIEVTKSQEHHEIVLSPFVTDRKFEFVVRPRIYKLRKREQNYEYVVSTQCSRGEKANELKRQCLRLGLAFSCPNGEE